MQLHICPKDCNHQVTGPDVLHAAGFWEVGERRQPCAHPSSVEESEAPASGPSDGQEGKQEEEEIINVK